MNHRTRVLNSETLQFDLGAQTIPVIVERKRIRHIYLYVKSAGRVVISAPVGSTEEEIRRFLTEKRGWLEKNLRNMREQTPKEAESYITEERILLWGEAHPLTYLPDKRFSLSVREQGAVLTAPPDSSRKAREDFIKKQLRMRLHRAVAIRLPFWEGQMRLHARAFTIRDMKSRWGSCNTGTGKITFHLQLISMPPECLDYVIVHELSHLVYPNHSPAFWAHVAAFLPAYKEIRKRMKDY
ncbi:MAG: M48 family metallopeptidase [Lachnospiraceae bacterium]|nr:M48 family metallopeptidase [Lachnospiraceae bacterium]